MRIKAFTLIEMIVAMIISSVVIGLALTVYGRINEYFIDLNKIGEKYNNTLMLVSNLRNDFERAIEIKGDNSQIMVLLENEMNNTYDFNGDVVVRTSKEQSDTFFLPQKNIETKYCDDKQEYLSELTIDFMQGEQIIQLHLIKDYSRDLMFNILQQKYEH
ncbi:MAG: hypothetical protein CVU05_08330 [Bacteroidetes bacterium HGW-Bacteroidetes-21]|jgi:prepilin-type N-terminal cleavage/methylation domain-containing protein|nr:MAG: hypothetical protein CVU05_08330 [Bacteroidetes bacterium HGW-Bacteroidetes-21]